MKRGRREGRGGGGEGRGEKAVWQRFCHHVPKAPSTANQDTLNGGKRCRGRQRGRGIGPIVDRRPSRQDSNRQKSHWTKKVVRNGVCRDHKALHFSGTGWALNILGEGNHSVRIVRATRSTQGELFHPLSGYHSLFRFSSPLLFFPPRLSHRSLSGWEPNADHPTGGVMLSKQMSWVETTLPPLMQLCV